MLETLPSGQGIFEDFETMEIPGLDVLPASLIPTVKNVIAATMDNPGGSMEQISDIYYGHSDGHYYRSCSVLDALSFMTLGHLATKRGWMETRQIDGRRVTVDTDGDNGLMVTDSRTIDMSVNSIHFHTTDIADGQEDTGKFKRILGLEQNQVSPLLQRVLLQPVLLEFQLLPGQKPSDIVFHQQTQIPRMTSANITNRCKSSLQKYKGLNFH